LVFPGRIFVISCRDTWDFLPGYSMFPGGIFDVSCRDMRGILPFPVGGQVERRRALLEAKPERMKKLFVDGDVGEAEYERERNEIRRELAEPVTPDTVSTSSKRRLCCATFSIWGQATLVERRKILQEVCEKVVIEDKTR
jgi:hypothetical protein